MLIIILYSIALFYLLILCEASEIRLKKSTLQHNQSDVTNSTNILQWESNYLIINLVEVGNNKRYVDLHLKNLKLLKDMKKKLFRGFKKLFAAKAESVEVENDDGFVSGVELRYEDGIVLPIEKSDVNKIPLNSTTIEEFKKKPQTKSIKNLFNDPFFPQQAYLFTRFGNDSSYPTDMGIMQLWLLTRNFGYNVEVMVLGHGISKENTDLLRFNKKHSLDLTPTNFKVEKKELHSWERIGYNTNINAGIIGMAVNNEICGVGIAPRAILSEVKYGRGSRYLTIDDLVQAIEHTGRYADVSLIVWILNYGHRIFSDANSIYRMNSVFQFSSEKGRNGKGVVHVLETGNYAVLGYNCAQNPLMNLIYTIGVASSNFNGDVNPIMEPCSAIMVTAYGTSSLTNNIVSTGIGNTCNSVSSVNTVGASMVASIIALILRAKPTLTWRDVQHLIVVTSQVHPLAHNKNLWKRNKAGLYISEYFGFGLINGYFMILLSTYDKYFPVPDMRTCTIDILNIYHNKNPTQSNVPIPFEFEFDSRCKDTRNIVKFMEHVQLQISLKKSARKEISISVTSPEGTESFFLKSSHVQTDLDSIDIKNWFLDSVMFWGETSIGKWKIKILCQTLEPTVIIDKLFMHVYGVELKPGMYYNDERRKRSSYEGLNREI